MVQDGLKQEDAKDCKADKDSGLKVQASLLKIS
jgi:hypothetical protein